MDSEKLGEMVLKNKFEQVRELLVDYSYKDLSKFLGNLANATSDERVYKFVQYLIEKEKNKDKLIDCHILASTILSVDIPYLSYSFEKAIFHVKKAIKLSPKDISIKEHLLFIYEDPNAKDFISNNEVGKIAREILEKDPNNEEAKRTLKYIKEDLNNEND